MIGEGRGLLLIMAVITVYKKTRDNNCSKTVGDVRIRP